MRPSVSSLVVLFVILMPLSISSAASADTISTVLMPFTGGDVELTLSDDVGDDIIRGSLEVVKGA
jgi:hypothetical protein